MVKTSGENTTIQVFGEEVTGTPATYPLADNFGADFVLFYKGEAANPIADGTVTITLEDEVILEGSYAEAPDNNHDAGATWSDGKWENGVEKDA